MRQFLLDLMKGMEAAIPPPPNCHHAITFAKHGSDEFGWTDKLALQVNINGKFYCFFLEDGDLTGDPQSLVRNISELTITLQEAQEGVALGQYIRD